MPDTKTETTSQEIQVELVLDNLYPDKRKAPSRNRQPDALPAAQHTRKHTQRR